MNAPRSSFDSLSIHGFAGGDPGMTKETILLIPNMASVSTFSCEICGRDGFTCQPEAGRHESVCMEEGKNRGFVRRFFGKRYEGRNAGIEDVQVESICFDTEADDQ